MTRLIINKVKLLKNFDFNIRGKNEIYFRCVCWLENDFSTAQYYPSKDLVGTEYFKCNLLINAKKNEEINLEELGGITIFSTDHSDVRVAIQNFIIEHYKLRIKESEKKILEERWKKSLEIRSDKYLKQEEKVHKLKLEKEKIRLECHKMQNDNAKLKEVYKGIIEIFNDSLGYNKNHLDKIKEFPSELQFEIEAKKNSINIEIEMIKANLRSFANKIYKYMNEPLVLRYIIQVLESDEEIRNFGSLMKNVNEFGKSMINPWIDVKNAEFDVYLAQLKQAEKIASESSDDLVFDKATFLKPTIYPKFYSDLISEGIQFIGTLLQANKDDEIHTFVKSIRISDNLDVINKVEDKIEINLKLANQQACDFNELPDSLKKLLKEYASLPKKTISTPPKSAKSEEKGIMEEETFELEEWSRIESIFKRSNPLT